MKGPTRNSRPANRRPRRTIGTTALPVGHSPIISPPRPQHVDRQEIAVQKDGSVLWRRRRHDTKRRLPHSRLLCVDWHLKPV